MMRSAADWLGVRWKAAAASTRITGTGQPPGAGHRGRIVQQPDEQAARIELLQAVQSPGRY